MAEIKREWVTSTLMHVSRLHPQAPTQMTILTVTLVLAAKTVGIPRDALLDVIKETWDVKGMVPGVKK